MKDLSNGIEGQIYRPIVQELYEWIVATPERHRRFDKAIRTAASEGVREMKEIYHLSDWLLFLDSLLSWTPYENTDGNETFNRFCIVYFILSQPSVYEFQNPIQPGASRSFTFVTDWITRFNTEAKTFMDTPESLTTETLATFEACAAHCFAEYLPPPGGWRTFNEYFARHVKPECRPIATPADPSVVACPTDFRYLELMEISPASTVTAKGITWYINELLDNSPYHSCFLSGSWIHGSLTTSDYHRVHSPVAGKVLQSAEIRGTHWAIIEPREGEEPGTEQNSTAKTLRKRRIFSYPNELGYHFQQIRGLVVIESAFGKVAVLPVGMGTVGSVVLTVEAGKQLQKGDEIGYFQFGGSDVVVLFEAQCKFQETATTGMHYKMGRELGRMSNLKQIPNYPVTKPKL
ncbi:hypothetical protein MMC10_002191 [Thelotrema lepadinum]|nr:hypothetical protein [Thelotrema lepadinum]